MARMRIYRRVQCHKCGNWLGANTVVQHQRRCDGGLLAKAASLIGDPRLWKGRCYEIASAFVSFGLTKGTAVYGHWTGPVAPGTMFHGKPLIQHGWVLLPDGRVLDPTRWVFLGCHPYVYIGPADHYDEGGNEHRRASMGDPPAFDPTEKRYTFTPRTPAEADAWSFIESLFGLGGALPEGLERWTLARRQAFWLANLPPDTMNGHAEHVFAMICRTGHAAMIPIDNRRMVERKTGRTFHTPEEEA